MQCRTETLGVATVMLWMNSGCNARCLTCEIWRERVGTTLSAAEIARHLPEWAARGVKLVELCGEPTIHPEFRQICELLAAAPMRFSVLSNGLKLREVAELIVRHADSLTVSLDGPPATHDAVRNVPRAFERLQLGVKAVRLASPEFRIYGRCAVHGRNYRTMAETVETARALRLTSISFFGLDEGTPAFGRERLEQAVWSERMRALAFTPGDMLDLADRLRALGRSHAGDFASGFIAEPLALLRRSLSPHQCRSDPPGGDGKACNAPYRSVVIEPNGDIKPCWFLESHGNLREAGTLHAVLETEAAEAVRRRATPVDNPVCQRCIAPRVFAESGISRSGLLGEPRQAPRPADHLLMT